MSETTTDVDHIAAERALENHAWDYTADGITVHAEYSGGVDEETTEALAEAGFTFEAVDVRGSEVDVKFEKGGDR